MTSVNCLARTLFSLVIFGVVSERSGAARYDELESSRSIAVDTFLQNDVLNRVLEPTGMMQSLLSWFKCLWTKEKDKKATPHPNPGTEDKKEASTATSAPALRPKTLPNHAVIVGMIRDDSEEIPRAIQIVEAIGALFADYDVVVLENDSRDDTAKQLREWSNRNHHVIVETNSFKKHRRESIQWLATLRNRLLEIAFQSSYASNIRHAWKADVVIVVDLDMKAVDMKGMLAATKLVLEKGGPVGATANGVNRDGRYYDLYAFRSCNLHWDTRKGAMFRHVRPDDWENLMPLYTSDLPPFPVDSAFSGVAVYRADAVFGHQDESSPATWSNTEVAAAAAKLPSYTNAAPVHTVYNASAKIGREDRLPCLYGDGGKEDCEHVPFSACLNARAEARGLQPLHVVPSFGVQNSNERWAQLRETEWILPSTEDSTFDPLTVSIPSSSSRQGSLPSHWRSPADPVKCTCQLWSSC